MTPISEPATILVTGANAGIGLAASRLVALKDSTTKVILGCRSEERAVEAKAQLERQTGEQIFEVLLIDLMDLQSVKDAVAKLDGAVDCLLLNAGGPGGSDFVAQTKDGIANIMALNVTGNALLVNELVAADKLAKESTVVYVSSEAARGVANMGFPAPEIESGSVEEFKAAIDGSKFVTKKEKSYENTYSWAKAVGVLWASAMARKQTDFRIVSVSPGMTAGTNLLNDLGVVYRILAKVTGPLLKLFGVGHGVDVGAERYLGPVYEPEKYENGVFYGSRAGKFTGELVDQTPLFEELGNEEYQDHAYEAIQSFL